MSVLFREIRQISSTAAAVLEEAGFVSDTDIQSLNRQDLNELFPGAECLRLRKNISDLIQGGDIDHHSRRQSGANSHKPINAVLKELLDFIPDDCVKAALTNNGVLNDYLFMLRDMKTKVENFHSSLEAHIDLFEEYTKKQEKAPPASSSADLEPRCAPVESQVYGRTDDHGQAQRTVRIQTMVKGRTFDCDRTVLQRVRQMGGLHLEETTSGKVVVVFCSISSRNMTDIEAAMKDVPGGAPVILVVMHHTHDGDYPHITRSLGSDHSRNVEDFVNVLYHETPGLLTCPLNERAVAQLHSALLKHSSVSPVAASASVRGGSSSVRPANAAASGCAGSSTGKTKAGGGGVLAGISGSEPRCAPVERQVYGRTDDHGQAQRTVRIQTMVRGQTFDVHHTLLQRVRQMGGLHLEETTSGKVIVVFCPVSSRHMTDIEAAMKDVPGGAPVILVVMHHTHDGDYPHITRSLGSDHSRNVEDFVNVLYHETPGLLTCPLNERAVAQLHSALLKHSSVSPVAASVYGGSSCVSPTAASASAYGGSSTGKTKTKGGGVFAGISGSEPRYAPVERQVCGRTEDHGQDVAAQRTVRIQTMVRGQTFDVHRTLLQRVRQMGGLHLEETTSGKVIVVFCPVSSRHMTDIEAAMKDVPGGAPVILVVMHHTRDGDYPNITRSLGSDHSWNVEGLVNVLYHEMPGLLTCPLNEQAVAQLHSALLKNSSVGPATANVHGGSSVSPVTASASVHGGSSSVSPVTAAASAYGGSSTGKTKGGGGVLAGISGSEPRSAPVERHFYGQTDDHGQAQHTVRIQTMVRGQTFDVHRTLLQRVRQMGGLHLEETTSGKVIVVFCPVSSRHMTDIEAAMKDVPGGAPVILVVMHHTRDSDYPNITRSLGSDHSWNVEGLVNVLYHEMPGLLMCPLNERAVAQLHSALLKHSSVSPATANVHGGSSVSPVAASASVHGGSSSVRPATAAASAYGGSSTGKTKGGGGVLAGISGSEPRSAPVERHFYGQTDDHGQAQHTVRIQTMVRGQTFDVHRTLLQRVRQMGGLHLEETTSGKVIVVFCPVSSRHMTDIEAAMKDVPGGAPVILVVMHHTHDSDYPNTTRSLGSDHSWNVEDFVNVLYHETPGLLTCPLNERAVAQLHSALLKHSSVSPTTTSGSVYACSSFVSPTAAAVSAYAGNSTSKTGSGVLAGISGSEQRFTPVERHFYGQTDDHGQAQRTVRIQTMVRGQTLDVHRTLLQRVRQMGGLHLEETTSGKVIVVFCPVSSRHMTDIEAAMKDVPGGAPVILVVMHHTRDDDYPNIPRSLGSDHNSWNVEDFVNVLYHETVPGLLTCPLNERAVAQLHSTLLKHSSVSPAAASVSVYSGSSIMSPASMYSGSSVSPAAASAYGGSSTGKTKGGGVLAGTSGSEPRCNPVERQVYGRTDDHGQDVAAQHTVRIQTMVRGQTFDGHRTLLQRVRQMGGLHLEETTSGKVIVVFCSILSRHMTDIEAAMKDVPGGRPVILVVMHHTRDGDYPHITRSLGSDHNSWNVEDFVNVLYHETVPGLLTCPLNERAVAQLHSALLKHSSVTPAAVSVYSGSSGLSRTAGSASMYSASSGVRPTAASVSVYAGSSFVSPTAASVYAGSSGVSPAAASVSVYGGSSRVSPTAATASMYSGTSGLSHTAASASVRGGSSGVSHTAASVNVHSGSSRVSPTAASGSVYAGSSTGKTKSGGGSFFGTLFSNR